jgi:hypothetical protein
MKTFLDIQTLDMEQECLAMIKVNLTGFLENNNSDD